MTTDRARPYCLLRDRNGLHRATGRIERAARLAQLPPVGELPTITMVPFRQIQERGFAAHDDGEPLLTLVCEEFRPLDPRALAPAGLPTRLSGAPVHLPDDDDFMAGVRHVIQDEIHRGEGSNFLLSRRCEMTIEDWSPDVALAVFARLVRNEPGAYLTFCFFDGERYFIGASPERHLTYRDGVITMNPICGTLPRDQLADRGDLLAFLSDPKEINELFQVVDEELKVMSRICVGGGLVRGPYLRELSAVVHTEYVLEGSADIAPLDAFRESMFAATMVGSPLENAARVITRHEQGSRGYYSGAVLIRGQDGAATEYLDSAITIRTMEVDHGTGAAVIRSGASIVRDSVPERECREVRAKAQGLLTAATSARPVEPILHRFLDEAVTNRLAARNARLSRFWFDRQEGLRVPPAFAGRSVLVLDNEDQFTHMLKHMLEHLGVKPVVRDYRDRGLGGEGFDLVLLGPGPGDPGDLRDRKIHRLHAVASDLLESGTPTLAVCLGHQVVCRVLGLPVVRVDPPCQGLQRPVDLFGRTEWVGLYNSFFAMAPDIVPNGLEICADDGGRVMALRADGLRSFQFHLESALTTNGVDILIETLSALLNRADRAT